MTPTPPEATKGELTRQALLDVAVARFGSEGFKGTSVAEITREAGLSGTAAYAYFDNKEALFGAALDQDAAGVINEAVLAVPATERDEAWRANLIFSLLESLDRHPLTRRVLAGLEPQVTDRMIDMPALGDLRRVVAQRIVEEQRTGAARNDIDPEEIGNGLVTLFIALLMSAVQFGLESFEDYGPDVMAVIAAAVEPVGPAR